MVTAPVILLLHKSSLTTAYRIKSGLPWSKLHGTRALAQDCDIIFDDFAGHIRNLFLEKQPIVAIASAGIVIRCLAECLRDKTNEPPVLAISINGASVVPLLGGHHGANELAEKIAEVLGTRAAITTASETTFGLALDQPPEGYYLANPENVKSVASAALNNHPVRINGEADWLTNSGLPVVTEPSSHFSNREIQHKAIEILISERNEHSEPGKLIYHPKCLAIGVGCERNCNSEELTVLVQTTLQTHDLSPHAVALLCSIDVKSDEPAIHETARNLGVPVRFFSATILNEQRHRLANPSDVVMREVGTPGVAEGSCLAAAGPMGHLIVEKLKSKRATCAIAKAPGPIDCQTLGRPRGRLSIVGIGPGKHEWRTIEAVATLEAAANIVGYELYLDLIVDLIGDKDVRPFPLGSEEERVRFALELAGEGRNVALVSSGDAGIYAMASLAFELVDQSGPRKLSPSARRVELNVIPGISAFQAAAARAGAPMGHDFCTISLSDLLTPWVAIENRIMAAAEADFVIAFYNPRSRNRTQHLKRAMEILAGYRPPDTPVITASRLGRDNENLSLFTIENFRCDHIDMQTLVIVGSGMSRIAETPDGKKWVYTPRGYNNKQGADS